MAKQLQAQRKRSIFTLDSLTKKSPLHNIIKYSIMAYTRLKSV